MSLVRACTFIGLISSSLGQWTTWMHYEGVDTGSGLDSRENVMVPVRVFIFMQHRLNSVLSAFWIVFLSIKKRVFQIGEGTRKKIVTLFGGIFHAGLESTAARCRNAEFSV